METTLIISIVSLIVSAAVGAFTIFANIRISKINNIEALKKNNREITGFELQFKDERWLEKILEDGTFDLYSYKSKQRIIKWWTEYTKYHPAVILKSQFPPEFNILLLGSPGPADHGWFGSTGKDDSDPKDNNNKPDDNNGLDW